MYVAQEIPEIPQAAMVVNEPGEPIDDFLKRVDEAGIRWPRIFRSSAVAELYGHDGDFPTHTIDSYEDFRRIIRERKRSLPEVYADEEAFSQFLKTTLNEIRFSPRELKRGGKNKYLPDKINIIAAERSTSQYLGTFIKHPNQDDYYIITVTEEMKDEDSIYFHYKDLNPQRSTFCYHPGEEVHELVGLSARNVDLTDALADDIKTVLSWHDRVAILPEMDPEWEYQFEAGLNPPCLYQIKPFKLRVRADFKVPNSFNGEQVVIGVSTVEGINARVAIPSVKGNLPTKVFRDPCVYVASLRNLRSGEKLSNLQANILSSALGLFGHEDTKIMRKAQVTVCIGSPLDPRNFYFGRGAWVNIISDGINVQVREIKPPK